MDERRKESLPQGTINIHFEDRDAFIVSLQPPEGFDFHPFGFIENIAEGQPGGIIKKMNTIISLEAQENTFSLSTYFEKENPTLPLDFDEKIIKESLAGLPYEVVVEKMDKGHVGYYTDFGYKVKIIHWVKNQKRVWWFSQTQHPFHEYNKLPELSLALIQEGDVSVLSSEVAEYLDHYTRILEGFLRAVYLKNEGALPNFEYVIKTPKPLILPAEEIGEKTHQRGELSFDDIGAQEEAVKIMRQVTNQINHPEVFRRWGAPLPKGILLVGPPGNGKTLMGRIMASEAGAYFDPLNLADILSKWVGETEQEIRRHFEEAKDRGGRTIIFLDEVDGIGKARKKLTQEHSAKHLLALTQEWDGITENPNVIVMGTTNRLEDVDPALLRENRFDIIVYMNNPDTPKKITEVLNIHAKKAEDSAERQLFTEVELSDVAIEIEKKFGKGNASCTRISEILQRVLRNKANVQLETGSEPSPVTIDDFKKVIEEYEERE